MKIIIAHLSINTYYDFDFVYGDNTPIKNHLVEQDGTYTVELKEGATIRTTDTQIVISYNSIDFDLDSYDFAQIRIV